MGVCVCVCVCVCGGGRRNVRKARGSCAGGVRKLRGWRAVFSDVRGWRADVCGRCSEMFGMRAEGAWAVFPLSSFPISFLLLLPFLCSSCFFVLPSLLLLSSSSPPLFPSSSSLFGRWSDVFGGCVEVFGCARKVAEMCGRRVEGARKAFGSSARCAERSKIAREVCRMRAECVEIAQNARGWCAEGVRKARRRCSSFLLSLLILVLSSFPFLRLLLSSGSFLLLLLFPFLRNARSRCAQGFRNVRKVCGGRAEGARNALMRAECDRMYSEIAQRERGWCSLFFFSSCFF